MSEATKYYTPAPEDIRVGFEFEYHQTYLNPQGWRNETIKPDDVEDISTYLWTFKHQSHKVRVPYLTAEQIESEGWKITKSDDLSIIFTNEKVVFHYGHDGANLTVLRMEPEDTIFMGKCRCKNDLRLICKMIGI